MATNMNKEQNKEQKKEQTTQGTSQTSSASAGNTASSTGSQPGKTENAALTTQSDRERPLQTGRDSGRSVDQSRSGLVRHRGDANSPFAVMQRMADDMDRLFEQFGFGRMGLGLAPRLGTLGSLLDDDLWSDRASQALNTVWTPQVETFRRGDNLVIRADIPGVNKEDVHVEVEDDVLTISGERKEEHEENRDGYYRSERSYGQFYRAIPLPEGVNAEKCDASFKDGVLEVTLPAPKQEERKAKRIQIR
jgi:HSP20 family protein